MTSLTPPQLIPNTSLKIALPKGRIMQDSLALLAQAGLALELSDNKRAMMHHTLHPSGSTTIIELRNADVPIYVELGVADVGIVGKDVLSESGSLIYEPVDLGFSQCRMSLIRSKGAKQPIQRVASKFPKTALAYFAAKGMSVEVVKLSGNVELACLTGLADAVVDIVQTGSTLVANDLEEVEVLFRSSARFVVNRTALKMKPERIRPLIERLRQLSAASSE